MAHNINTYIGREAAGIIRRLTAVWRRTPENPVWRSMMQLVEKYKPTRLVDFIGLERAKAILLKFAANPYPSAWLFLGPSGLGKTTMALALADELHAEVHHVASKSCDMETVNDICHKCHYVPLAGRWHCVIVDEADQMSHAAQLAFLSKLDTTAAPPDTIFLFTANVFGYGLKWLP